jgi:hypothetical protein
VNFTVSLTTEDKKTLVRGVLTLMLEEVRNFLRLTVKERLTPQGIVINAKLSFVSNTKRGYWLKWVLSWVNPRQYLFAVWIYCGISYKAIVSYFPKKRDH